MPFYHVVHFILLVLVFFYSFKIITMFDASMMIYFPLYTRLCRILGIEFIKSKSCTFLFVIIEIVPLY